MKVRSSVKPICEKCKIIKRKGSSAVDIERSMVEDFISSDVDVVRYSPYRAKETNIEEELLFGVFSEVRCILVIN